jgi:hypothetical protein
VRYGLLGLGLVAAIAVAIGVIVVATSSDGTLVLDLAVGDCFELELDDDAVEVGTVDTVECETEHGAEVVAIGDLDPDGTFPRPQDEELFALIDARCADALAERPVLLQQFGILPVAADDSSWESYDGRYVCVAIPYGGGTTAGSALDLDQPLLDTA